MTRQARRAARAPQVSARANEILEREGILRNAYLQALSGGSMSRDGFRITSPSSYPAALPSGPWASWRDEVVPTHAPPVAKSEGRVNGGSTPTPVTEYAVDVTANSTSAGAPQSRRLPRAQLLARVFLADALACAR